MQRSWLMLFVMVLLAAFATNYTSTRAQEPEGAEEAAAPEVAPAPPGEAAAPEAAPERGVSVFRLVLKHSGWPGWVIIGMSVVAFYLVVRFLWNLRRNQFVPPGLLEELTDDVGHKRIKEAVEKCRDNDSVLARVAGSGLAQIRSGYDEMVSVAEEVGEEETVRLQQQVGWLALIGAITPMLGLTGTVLGMMRAFGTISQMETQPPPRLLASHIQLALVTTCEGLIVAVPVLLAYAVFRNRVTTLMLEAGVAISDLIGRFKGVEITAAMTAGVTEAAQKPRKAPPPPPPPPPEE